MSKILVAFATRNGSTREVAGAIAGTLRAADCAVDLRPAREVREPVAGWDLVVLGAPIYSGRWHSDAHRFLRRHRNELANVPVAVFGMGPRSGAEEGWQRSRGQLDRALAKRGWLAPVTIAVFGGVDPPKRRRNDGTSVTGRRSAPGPSACLRWSARRLVPHLTAGPIVRCSANRGEFRATGSVHGRRSDRQLARTLCWARRIRLSQFCAALTVFVVLLVWRRLAGHD